MRETGQVSTVKISRPKVSGVAPRTRLFRLLDSSRKKPVVWISGPAGSGKTTLAASWLDARKLPCIWYQVDEGDGDIASFFYHMGLAAKKAAPRYKKPLPLLTPEYLQGIPTFTRRYFEELFRRLKPPVAVVFDNYQDAPLGSGFHEVIANALETAPEGINVIVLSRTEPPAQLARLRANNKIAVIGWNELSFTHKECRDFLKAKGGRTFSDKTINQLHERTDGWAAGLVLMTEAAKTKEIRYSLINELSREAVFNYFASEIFEKTDGETRGFLLDTSFFPSMSVKAAEELTGNAGTRSLLSRLSRDHYFTDWRPLPMPIFQYHPLFKEFLQARARSTFSREELAAIQSRTAVILEAEGRMEEAAGLFINAGDWEGLVGLILRQAESLITQGRQSTLERWISAVPEESRAEVHWLSYWLGICRDAFDPAGAREHLQRAHQAFKRSGDIPGLLLSCSGIVDTFAYEWNDFTPLDFWIGQLHECIPPAGLYPSAEIELKVVTSMAVALMIRRPDIPGITEWFEMLSTLGRRSRNENLMLHAFTWAINYYYWVGDHVRGRMLLKEVRKLAESPNASPLAKVTWMWMEAATLIDFDAAPASTLTHVHEALQYGNDTGIHVWDHMLFALGVHASLIEDDFDKAAFFLRMIESVLQNSRRHGYCHFHYLSAWYHLLRGDLTRAAADAEAAREIADETGYVFPVILSYLLLADVRHGQGCGGEARDLIERASWLCLRSKNTILGYMCLLAEARTVLDSGLEEETRESLKRAFQLGREKGYTYLPWMCQPSVLARLCAKALQLGIETEYVRNLARKFGLAPPSSSPDVLGDAGGGEDWPYPVKIYTLGNFRLLKDDMPMEFAGKIQQKPLAMLKALASLGGRDVSEKRLSDVLWPDAEGDLARKSLEMTLLRLRRLLGWEEAVSLKGGALSLDHRLCWVDVQAFESLAKSAEEAWHELGGRSKNKNAEAVRLSEKALAMYSGPFLPNDVELDCTTALREKMRNTALQLVRSLGSHWEAAQQWRKAIECFRNGIEIDNLFEDFYHRLMVCHENLGQRAEAVRVYGQCQTALSSNLGIGPSAKTQEIYNRIRRTR